VHRKRARTGQEIADLFKAPSAMPIRFEASWLFRIAALRPLICDLRPSLIIRSAGPSAATLILKPLDSFWSVLPRLKLFTFRFLCVFSAEMLFCTLSSDISYLLVSVQLRVPSRSIR
jgi:hypothetical protein